MNRFTADLAKICQTLFIEGRHPAPELRGSERQTMYAPRFYLLAVALVLVGAIASTSEALPVTNSYESALESEH